MLTALSVTDVYVNGALESDPDTSPPSAVPAVTRTNRIARMATRRSLAMVDYLRDAPEHVGHTTTETRRRCLAFASNSERIFFEAVPWRLSCPRRDDLGAQSSTTRDARCIGAPSRHTMSASWAHSGGRVEGCS